jgi:two-component system NtrC family sensor kinase
MRNTLLIFCFLSMTIISNSQIGFCEFSESSSLEDWKKAQYENVSGNIINLGLKRGTYIIHWKFDVDSVFWNRKNVLHIANPILDDAEVFQVTQDSTYHTSSGEKIALADREFNISGNAITIRRSDDNIVEFYFKVKSSDQLLIPLNIIEENDLLNEYENIDLIFAIYLGIILSMFIYNLFVFFSVRDSVYLLYIFYIITVGYTQLVLFGFSSKYIFNFSGALNISLGSIVPGLSGLATVFFAQNFIRTKQYSPKINNALNLFKLLYSVAIILAFFGFHNTTQIILNVGASSALILIFASVSAIKQGYRPAKYFIIAWIIFIIGLTLYALRNFGILPFNAFTNFALPVGSVVEILLLSFALADRINVLKQEKELSQQQAFVAMKENERLVTEQNIQLEKKVHERTADLENRNTELHTAMNDLRMTQQQLVESEKLASIGQMTAGIAHEINNPINFVQSNVGPLKRDIDEILELLSQLAHIDENKDLLEQVNHLKSQYIKLDVDYLKKEIEQLLNGIEDGSKRTAEIVKGLRVFSRMDRNELVSADINECLHSTLVVMKNMTKAEVTLNVELGENIPKIKCYPGKLSQVFMNLVTNAVQATRIPGRQPIDRVINVRSYLSDNNICVEIQDNGNGIPMEIQEKIFEPFFTTKDVGEGTGLGLSIVAGIVGEHNGQLTFTSKANEGTTFLITLPTDSKNP